MKYANKTFYIPSVNQLVYCHKQTHLNLIIGDLCGYVTDAKTSTGRQKISIYGFSNLSPVEVNEEMLSTYAFLTTSEHESFLVKGVYDELLWDVKGARRLPDAEITKPIFERW